MNFRRCSFGLKHIFEHETGLYISNDAFKAAMLSAGYQPETLEAENPCYRITELNFTRGYISLGKRFGRFRKPRGWWLEEHHARCGV